MYDGLQATATLLNIGILKSKNSYLIVYISQRLGSPKAFILGMNKAN